MMKIVAAMFLTLLEMSAQGSDNILVVTNAPWCTATVVPEREEFSPGEAVGIIFTIENHGDVPVRFWGEFPLTFHVTYADGSHVPRTAYSKRGRNFRHTGKITSVGPNEELAHRVLLSRVFDMTLPAQYIFSSRSDVWRSTPDGRAESNIVLETKDTTVVNPRGLKNTNVASEVSSEAAPSASPGEPSR